MDRLKQDWEGQQESGSSSTVNLRALLVSLMVFVPLWFLCFVGFTAVLILAEPSRSNILALLALFILIVGTGASAGFAFSMYHKMKRKLEGIVLAEVQDKPDPFNQVFTNDDNG